MEHWFHAVSQNINKLLAGLASNPQMHWDVRVDFLAFQHGNVEDGIHWYRSVNYNSSANLIQGIYGEQDDAMSEFFTKDIDHFRAALETVAKEPLLLEEEQLLALDIALDYPWRTAEKCHRVVVLLTDESVETGIFVDQQLKKLPELMAKVGDKFVKLFIVAPESNAFYKLSNCEYSEYEIIPEYEMKEQLDFGKLLYAIGSSLSSHNQQYLSDPASNAPKPLFGQEHWQYQPDVYADDLMDDIRAHHQARRK